MSTATTIPLVDAELVARRCRCGKRNLIRATTCGGCGVPMPVGVADDIADAWGCGPKS